MTPSVIPHPVSSLIQSRTKPIFMTKHTLLQKRARLDRAKSRLKAEFFGIDGVIDQLVDAISSWFLTPELQDRPMVVNLWGLTGVGKSSLVMRLAELLDLTKDTYVFDLGEQQSGNSPLQSAVGRMQNHGTGRANLIILDEFQHARTLDEGMSEINIAENRIIWQLLDSGIFHLPAMYYNYQELMEILPRLRYMLQTGIRVENGMVVEGADHFISKMDLRRITDNEPVPFVNPRIRDHIADNLSHEFATVFELSDLLDRLDGPQTITFLSEALTRMQATFKVDCTKSLILVLGNLDEAYPMHNSMNPDLDADDIHELSKKITITDVKSALQRRFRNEQIARLGNLHILYPAFNRAAFEAIIGKELDSIAAKMAHVHKIRIRFDASIHDIVYREGVFPTQGARPLLSTVHHVVRAKLPTIAAEATLHGLSRGDILVRYESGKIIAEMRTRKGELKHVMELPHELLLEPLRKVLMDDMQAISAVHEAGHAVAYSALLSLIPESVFSKTADSDAEGFVFAKNPLSYVSRHMVMKQLACNLAGHVAERMIFGEEHVTIGSENDIRSATNEIVHALKACGMGEHVAAYHVPSDRTVYYVHDAQNRISGEAEQWLAQAMRLAEETLRSQERLLLAVADYLSDHRQIERNEYIRLLQEFAVGLDVDAMQADRSLSYYRKELKRKVGQSNQLLPIAV